MPGKYFYGEDVYYYHIIAEGTGRREFTDKGNS